MAHRRPRRPPKARWVEHEASGSLGVAQREGDHMGRAEERDSEESQGINEWSVVLFLI